MLRIIIHHRTRSQKVNGYQALVMHVQEGGHYESRQLSRLKYGALNLQRVIRLILLLLLDEVAVVPQIEAILLMVLHFLVDLLIR